ncbi:hypothetical protein M0R45_004842 [Rubus argutus]|uniref:Reverse transcriptase zinc-binding domain-containing protein n=1 Tax=Rubus argutus TaxID=59490 RepID=A0AAW1YKX2_RUBAR
MASPKSTTPPSHVLFANDVMTFMQGSTLRIKYLMKFLKEYANNLGQSINRAKSSAYLGKHARSREIFIQHLLGIREGVLPFTYLGVPIFKGQPKSNFFCAIADKVRCKLSSWKGHQFSKVARMQLIPSLFPWSRGLTKPFGLMHVAFGHLTSKEAYNFLAPTSPKFEWGKLIWQPLIQPRKSNVTWMVLHGRALVDSLLQKKGSIWWMVLPGFLITIFNTDLESRISYRFR